VGIHHKPALAGGSPAPTRRSRDLDSAGLEYPIGHDREPDYFSIAELDEVPGPMGLRVERDLYFTPQRLAQCN